MRSSTLIAIAAGEVHVWPVSLAPDCHAPLRWLGTDERARLDRLRGDQRHRFAVSHTAMRAVLSTYLDCAPADVPVHASYGQPPRVPGLSISLAHTDGLALVAVSPAAVGVDVDAVATADDPDLDDVAAITLSPAELAGYRRLPPAERPASWLRSWVRKEAVLKARGEGLGDRLLRDVDVRDDHRDGLTIVDLDTGPAYLSAVAVAHEAPVVTLRELAA